MHNVRIEGSTIMHIQRSLPALILTLVFAPTAGADDPALIPAHERALVEGQDLDGPTETRGIESAVVLGAIPLGQDFEGMDGRVLRARIVTLGPGGTVGVHQHESRPGVAYILDGRLTEHRNDADKPLERGAGAASFEHSGLIHWWVNESSESARALIIDIVRTDGD